MDASLRLYATCTVFSGGRFRHECQGGCGNVMVVPDPCTEGAPDALREGQIWGCIRCRSAHEYYLVLTPGVRMAGVRLLADGPYRRTSAEPTVDEFVPEPSRLVAA